MPPKKPKSKKNMSAEEEVPDIPQPPSPTAEAVEEYSANLPTAEAVKEYSQHTDFCKSTGHLVGQCVANFCNRATILQRCTITCDVSCNNLMVAKHSHPPSCNLKKSCTTLTIYTTLYDVRAIARATEMR